MNSADRVIIVGGGMSGILSAIKLLEMGHTNFVVYEKNAEITGTWTENRYPGLTCDVPAHAYTYSFEPWAEWDSFYATGAQIKTYFEHVVDKYGVRPFIETRAEVTEMRWLDDRWHVTLKDGRIDCGKVLIAATGVLHHPNIPHIDGMESFEGAMFHTTRWDYTAPLDGARIGVIGTGSTGAQVVSALSTRASSLVHFIRSPQWIMPVKQFDYTEEDKANFRADPNAIDAVRRGPEYLMGVERFNMAIIDPDSPQMHEIEEICRRNLEDSIKDESLREKLRPNYRAACKRLVYSWDYYNAVQRPGVVVETTPIERVETGGIRMKDGSFHELDVIALATGFRADRFMRPSRVYGRNGADLETLWAKRPTAHYAITLPDFPNLFMLNGPTGPAGNFSLIDIAEYQWGYISQLLKPLLDGTVDSVVVKKEAHAAYDTRRIEAAKKTIFGSGCTSWYLDDEGVPGTWPWTYPAFEDAMKSPNIDEFEFSLAKAPV